MSGSNIKRFPVTIDGETTMIGTANELAIVLDVLHGQHDRVVLEQLQPHLADIIATPVGLVATMKSLEPADQLFLIEALGSRLARILQKSTYLADLLAALATVEVKEAILQTLGTEGLRALVSTAPDLANVLQWAYGHSDQRVIDLLGANYVRQVIRTGQDLGAVLSTLEVDAQNNLLGQLGLARVVEIVRDGRELAYTLRAIPAAHRASARLLDQYSRAQLLALIGNASDWKYLWTRLEPEEQELILNKLGVEHNAA
jgi:hypothetical protein